jgi:nucleoid DNA-binding protein
MTEFRYDVADLLDKALGKTIPRMQILDILAIVVEYMVNELENNRDVYLGNFGVFSLTQYNGSRIVKFRPHEAFKEILTKKRKQNRLKRLTKQPRRLTLGKQRETIPRKRIIQDD